MLWRAFTLNIRHLSPAQQVKVEEAFRLSERVHEGQQRASGKPFFTHPLAVAEYLANLKADAETIISALLHDAVEDTPLTLAEVKQRFGAGVAVMIEGLTKLQEHELADQPTLNQKIESLRRIFNVMQHDVRIMTIKLADRLHNMQTIGFRPPDKQRAVAKETLDIYVKIADRLCMRKLRDELAMLCHAVLEPKLYVTLLNIQKNNTHLFQDIAATMQKRLADVLPDLQNTIHLGSKSWENLLMQYELNKETSHPPLLNAVFRCDSVDACYRTLGAIHQIWPRIILTFDDFINVPAVNGYQGLQTTVVLEDGTHIRCKIRTHAMYAYAHHGIATVCYDRNAHGVLHYLPWTKHIGPLAKENRNRSATFWETLQSDILSEAFIIYGNENRSVLVPPNATALDGALYLYPETALRLTDIFINGKKVPYTHVLARADVLEIATLPKKQVKREWLYWSRTGIGTVMIRTALAGEKWSIKIETGKKLLQDHLLAHHHGFLSELNTDYLGTMLKQHGIDGDLDKIFVQIAEGRVLPEDVERSLYPSTLATEIHSSVWMVRCTILTEHRPLLLQIMQNFDCTNIRIRNNAALQTSTVKMTCSMTASEVEELEQRLQTMENSTYHFIRRRDSILRPLGWVLMFLLWGADPVFAHLLLQRPDITPINLTIIRFLSYTAMTGVLLLWMMRYRSVRQVRLSLRSSSLWLTALFLFLVSITSYIALQQDSPLHYTIPMTIAGLFLATLMHKKHFVIQAAVWGSILTSLWTLWVRTPEWSVTSMVATASAVLSFTLFSILSERYKRVQEVSTRVVQYLFLISILCTLFSIPLLIFTGITPITPASLLLSVLFTAGITGTPYFIYYLLSHNAINIANHYSFLIIPATLIFQIFFDASPTSWMLTAGGLTMAGAMMVPLFNNGNQSKQR